jgi:protein-tyrosine-phosphatase
MARTADLILTMERMHTDFIAYHWPDVRCAHELKRYGLDRLSDMDDTDVPDPIGFGIDVYREVFSELREEVVRVSRVLFPLVRERFSTL